MSITIKKLSDKKLAAMKMRQQIEALSQLYNFGMKMCKIQMKNGIFEYPECYILLNPEEAIYSDYPVIVELINADSDILHFVFFTTKNRDEFTDKDKQQIQMLCAQKWPRFKDVVSRLVEPSYNESSIWPYLNAEELRNASQISYYAVPDEEDPTKKCNRLPRTARILR